ncbi:hypothetical protein FB451DRAFT_1202097 [Mycena latifolia]|nr:hypothetical protein FB451DRAFT_1202097 [Mycena latifolia]
MSNDSLRAQDLILAISSQKHGLNDPEAQIKSLQQQLDSIVYPVLTLPPEITSEIFVRCLPAAPDQDAVNLEEAPLLLMHVCSTWKQIAVSTAALWMALNLNVRRVGPLFPEVFDTWLTRARGGPLSVKIAGPLFDSIDDSDGYRFMESFRRHASGMRSLELNLTVEDFETMATDRLGFPVLQNLSICLLPNEEDLSVHHSIQLFHDVPILRSVLMLDAPLSFVALPWQQLTKFSGDMYTIDACLEALRFMPNLVEFGAPASAPLSHSKIESLTLFESTSVDWADSVRSGRLLKFLTLPGLQALQILGTDGFDKLVLNSFISRSVPPLRKLLVRPLVSDIPTEISMSSFLTAPSLIHLEIWRPSQSFAILFFAFFGSHGLLPQLQRLSFSGCREGDSKAASLLGIIDIAAAPIADRRKSCAGMTVLQSFRLVSESDSLPHFLEAQILPFEKLKAEGMVIYIGTKNKSVI